MRSVVCSVHGVFVCVWKKNSFKLRDDKGRLVKVSVVDYVPLLENDDSAYAAKQEETSHQEHLQKLPGWILERFWLQLFKD